MAACAKHFVANNQEEQRGSINVELSERALQEIYLPGFKAAVDAGVLTFMGAYNKLRGEHCCHNDYLLNTILKDQWGFDGLVMSDWGGAHDTRQAALNGLDLEMGTHLTDYDSFYLADPFLKLLRSGEIDESVVNDKVYRILYVMLHTNMVADRKKGAFNTPEHQQLTRKLGEEAVVLLKNDGILPLDAGAVKSVAVIGENAVRELAYGGGSSAIKALYEVTPLQGLVDIVGDQVDLHFSMGYSSEETTDAMIERAVETAQAADVAVVFGGLNHDVRNDSEMEDRLGMKLPYRQDDLIAAVTAANPKTVVVNISGSPVNMQRWLDAVPAVVQGWYAGMEAGHVFADVLFGNVNPGGKLTFTFPKTLADSPAHAIGEYPGDNGTVHYKDDIFVGYRYFDTMDVEPQFGFGHGLSYTTFEYGDVTVTETENGVVELSCEVTNTGGMAGSEVVQAYVQDVKCKVERPQKELKGYKKVHLEPGETQTVRIRLDAWAFAYFHPKKERRQADRGDFVFHVGSSSRDIRQTAPYQLAKNIILE